MEKGETLRVKFTNLREEIKKREQKKTLATRNTVVIKLHGLIQPWGPRNREGWGCGGLFHENETRLIIEPVSRKSWQWSTKEIRRKRETERERGGGGGKEENGQGWMLARTGVENKGKGILNLRWPGLRFYFIRTFLNGTALTLSVIPLRLHPPLSFAKTKTVKSVLSS